MPEPNRLLIVARHYWPCTSDAALQLRLLARQLRPENWTTTVLTPRWHPSWPETIQVEDAMVVRLSEPPVSPLHQATYRRNLSLWLGKEANQFQAILCDRIDEDTLKILDWASAKYSRPTPVVVRFDPNELSCHLSDASIGGSMKATIREVCIRATRTLAPSQTAHQQLIALGVPPDRIARCSDWHVPMLDRSYTARREARRMLAEINCDLVLHPRDQLIVIPSDLSKLWNIDFAIGALWRLLDDRPGLRMWILGDGPKREKIYNELKKNGVHRIVALPGVYTSVDSLLQAADLCLFPGRGCGLRYLLPTCIASGIPSLAARSPEIASQLGPSNHGAISDLSFEPRSDADLVRCTVQWLEQPKKIQQAAFEFQQQLRQHRLSDDFSSGLVETLISIFETGTALSSRMSPDWVRMAQ